MTAPLVLQTALSLTIGGQRAAGALARTLSRVLVRQALAAPTVAELDFCDLDIETAKLLAHGEEVRLGHPAGESIFHGEIARIEHDYDGSNGYTLRIRAYDRLQRLRVKRRVRAFSKTSAAALASELAADIGCDAAAARPTPERDLVIQQGESDFELLTDLAADAGLYPFLAGDTLCLIGLDGEGDAIPLTLGRSLYAVRTISSNERALARTETRGWTPATSDRIQGAAETASQDAVELRDIGLQTLASERLILTVLLDNEAEARALAQASMDRAASNEVSVVGTAPGDPSLRPGRGVQIGGVTAMAGRYVISEALHRFDTAGGYTTEFATTPPPRPVRPRHTSLSIGEVSSTNDPAGYGRCRVTLPAFSGIESGWMPVLVPGAGKGKGMAALPEAGDEVLIVFPDGDPARGIVLGGLYGRQRVPRGVARKRARPFVLRTGGGQSLELSAEGAYTRLSNSVGSLLELDHGRMRLAAATDLVIEAPGRTITIRGAAVNFERG
jgi:uncharacterized protein involved in type VI secretion and phage assembly